LTAATALCYFIHSCLRLLDKRYSSISYKFF